MRYSEAGITVALFGSVNGHAWRPAIQNMPLWDDSVAFYDPQTTFTVGPEHVLEERKHYADTVRVLAITDQSYSRESFVELGHFLTTGLDTGPLAVYVAPRMDPAHGTGEDMEQSNLSRGDMLVAFAAQAEHPNLHIAESLDELQFIASALITNSQMSS